MKRLYLFFVALLTCSAIASAADWDIVLNITKGADLVDAKIGDDYANATSITLKNGENSILIPEQQNLYITPKDDSYNVTFKDSQNAIDKVLMKNYYLIYAAPTPHAPNNPYTLTVVDPNAKEEEDVQGWKVIINVTGAENVTAGITSGYFAAVENVTLKDGDNTVNIPEDQYLSVAPKGDAKVTFTDNKGESVTTNMMDPKAFMLWANPNKEPANPYTLIAKDTSSERTQSVTVTMDEPSLVTIKRNGKNGVNTGEFKPSETESSIQIPYNPETEQELAISHNKWGKFYQVIVDGEAAPKPDGSTYYIKLVNTEGDKTTYVENIDIKVNFPEDLKYKTTFTLDGPEEMISSIKVDDIEVEDIAASLKDGIETTPLSTIKILFNEDYTIESLSDNGKSPDYIYSSYEISKIDRDHNISIKGKAPKNYDVIFNVTGAEGLVAKYRSSGETISLKEGKNTISFSEKDNKVKFLLANGQYKFQTFADNHGYSYPNDYTLQYDGSIWADVEEDDELTIVVEKIQRDNKLVLYYDDFTDRKADTTNPLFFGPTFAKYTDLPNKIKPGYNIIEFRDEDGSLSVNSNCSYTKLYPYKNGEIIAIPWGAKFTDEKVADGDVYKVFFDNDPGVHTVTFNVEDGALDGYEVKKDIIADADVTAPVKAVGPTRFTIAPVAKAASAGLVVKVGDNEIEAVDGVYTFETTADATVNIAAAEVKGWEITLNIAKGADLVDAKIGKNYENATAIELNDGENTFTIPEDQTLYVTPKETSYKVTFKDASGANVNQALFQNYYIIYAKKDGEPKNPYTLSVVDPAAPVETFNVVFNITGAEGLVATYKSTGEKIDFVDGENTIAVPENDRDIIFALADNDKYKWVTFTDGNYNGLNYIEDGKIYWEIDKGVEYTIVIEKAAPKTFDVVFNITGAEGLVATYKSTGEKIDFVDGENTIAVPENDRDIIFALADNDKYKWVTFTDGNYNGLNYIEDGKIYWEIDKGVEYTIVVEKIPSTGIDAILNDANGPVDVYNLQGVRVLRDATADDVKTLAPGFYIVNRQKVLVK